MLSGQACICIDWQSWSTATHAWMSTCSGNDAYTVTWSSHAIFDPVGCPMTMAVNTILPTTNDYVRPFVVTLILTLTIPVVTAFLLQTSLHPDFTVYH